MCAGSLYSFGKTPEVDFKDPFLPRGVWGMVNVGSGLHPEVWPTLRDSLEIKMVLVAERTAGGLLDV